MTEETETPRKEEVVEELKDWGVNNAEAEKIADHGVEKGFVSDDDEESE
jgi:hypothetical protein